MYYVCSVHLQNMSKTYVIYINIFYQLQRVPIGEIGSPLKQFPCDRYEYLKEYRCKMEANVHVIYVYIVPAGKRL